MKTQILFYATIFLIADAAVIDQHSELEKFGGQGVLPEQTNGTVSEQISYMASIRLSSFEATEGFGFGHFCGGVFVSRRHILTLATCLSRSFLITAEELQIVAGTRYRYDPVEAHVYHVEKYELHPNYSVSDITNNLAIIFLKETVGDVLTISTVTIGETTAELNQHLQIFGWGTPYLTNGPRELHTGRITIVDREVCAEQFSNRFCAGPNFYGGCQGDDGGAAILNKTLVGLVDYRSAEYCSNEKPGHLYVNVIEYRDWIEKTINGCTTSTVSLMLISFAVIFSTLTQQ